MITILVGRDGRPSMKKVFGQMKSEGILKVRRIPPKTKRPYVRVYEGGNSEKFTKKTLNELNLAGQKVIRWGNRIEAETNKDTIMYNKSEAIAKATDKKLSRELFIKDKVRCPQFADPDRRVELWPVIARPHTHAKGKNFVILNNTEEFVNHYNTNHATWYYSEFVNKDREFRVHCAHGKILAIMEKARGGDTIAWNRHQTGEAFTKVAQKDYIYTVCFQALKAIKVLGLDFGGVDVMLLNKDAKDKSEAFVLEVNTSPTLNSSDWVSAQYALYFDWLNRAEGRREHWDFSKFEKAESFAWKQFQLNETKSEQKIE